MGVPSEQPRSRGDRTWIGRLLDHPGTLAVAAGGLFLTSAHEVIVTFEELSFQAHHGVLLYSMLHLARAVHELVEGRKISAHALSRGRARHGAGAVAPGGREP